MDSIDIIWKTNEILISTKDKYGYTLLHSTRSLNFIKYLIKMGSDLTIKDKYNRTFKDYILEKNKDGELSFLIGLIF